MSDCPRCGGLHFGSKEGECPLHDPPSESKWPTQTKPPSVEAALRERFEASERLRHAGIDREAKAGIRFNEVLQEVAALREENARLREQLDQIRSIMNVSWLQSMAAAPEGSYLGGNAVQAWAQNLLALLADPEGQP